MTMMRHADTETQRSSFALRALVSRCLRASAPYREGPVACGRGTSEIPNHTTTGS